MKSRLLAVLFVATMTVVIAPIMASAAILGSLGNFDVINDTGKTAHGFEIDLEGLQSSDISDVFGGPGRGFPTGRGFDPKTSVERYGSPTISEYTNGAFFGTKMTYLGVFNGTSWDYDTPSGTFITPGDNCWSGGGPGYGPGTLRTPTKIIYSWLVETGPAMPGVVTNGTVSLPAPAWNIIPPPPPFPGNPPAPPQVIAYIHAPEPPDPETFGDALWVKVFTKELEHPVELEDLVADNAHVKQAKTEIERQLLQKDPGNPASGQLESGFGVPVGPNAASILRRYEFYEFSGIYNPQNHEESLTKVLATQNHARMMSVFTWVHKTEQSI